MSSSRGNLTCKGSEALFTINSQGLKPTPLCSLSLSLSLSLWELSPDPLPCTHLSPSAVAAAARGS